MDINVQRARHGNHGTEKHIATDSKLVFITSIYLEVLIPDDNDLRLELMVEILWGQKRW